MPGGHGPHRRENAGLARSLENEAAGAGSERLTNALGIVACGDHECLAVRNLGEDATNRLDDPVRWNSVQHDDVRRLGVPLEDRVSRSLRFPDHLDVVVAGQQVSNPGPRGMIAR